MANTQLESSPVDMEAEGGGQDGQTPLLAKLSEENADEAQNACLLLPGRR